MNSQNMLKSSTENNATGNHGNAKESTTEVMDAKEVENAPIPGCVLIFRRKTTFVTNFDFLFFSTLKNDVSGFFIYF